MTATSRSTGLLRCRVRCDGTCVAPIRAMSTTRVSWLPDRSSALRRRQFRHRQIVDRQGLYARVLSTSYIAIMDEDERRDVMADVAAVVEELPEPIVFRM